MVSLAPPSGRFIGPCVSHSPGHIDGATRQSSPPRGSSCRLSARRKSNCRPRPTCAWFLTSFWPSIPVGAARGHRGVDRLSPRRSGRPPLGGRQSHARQSRFSPCGGVDPRRRSGERDQDGRNPTHRPGPTHRRAARGTQEPFRSSREGMRRHDRALCVHLLARSGEREALQPVHQHSHLREGLPRCWSASHSAARPPTPFGLIIAAKPEQVANEASWAAG